MKPSDWAVHVWDAKKTDSLQGTMWNFVIEIPGNRETAVKMYLKCMSVFHNEADDKISSLCWFLLLIIYYRSVRFVPGLRAVGMQFL